VGFAGFFIFLDQTGDDSGMWPLLGTKVAALPLCFAVVAARRDPLVVPRRAAPLSLLSGVLDMTANVLYLLALRRGQLAVIAGVVSLYPVSTVLLAIRLDGERVGRAKAVGFLLTGVALVLVAVGKTEA
jgi:drug/metabolite transporter (DMT)-like permease